MVIHIIKHAEGAPGLRLLGLGPGLLPSDGLKKLQNLFNRNAFWAKDRDLKSIRKMLANSSGVISIWKNKEIIGFGRVTTDCSYRAVIWDVIVEKQYQGSGIGKLVIAEILKMKKLRQICKIYVMTTNQKDFYLQMGFKLEENQYLMIKE
ncbi:GNAT family N-acetyltransferase [Prochlorococcus sp. MIT 0801]|uniref:GNAT family N-acetyltransferase n=1 Tax=Prochlorococcus sp. MIT 0801 TaxID=1501269 RepID=UPI0004F6ABEA|nr:GNAT family N-acetyltransferase [Prochlorococcus sp. MIT 0801]AIQ98285.1 putative acetyltransferase [Prochlorococcus sp. MIT 0801]